MKKKIIIVLFAVVFAIGLILSYSFYTQYHVLSMKNKTYISEIEKLNLENNELVKKLEEKIIDNLSLQQELEELEESIEFEGISRSGSEISPLTPTPTLKPIQTPTPKAVSQSNLELLARIIYCEAGGEGENDQLAVGQVVLNRAKELGLTLKETIYQRLSNGTYIFSPVASSKYSSRSYSKQSEEIARRLLNGEVFEPVGKALYFCTIRSYNSGGWHYKYVKSGKGIITYKTNSTVYID